MFNGEVTERTIELLKGIDLAKATFQTSTGLVNYDLTGPAKLLYPVLSPLRNGAAARDGQRRYRHALEGDHRN